MAGLQSELFRIGLSALWYSGVARLLEPLTRGRGTILMLHRAQPESAHPSFAPNRGLSITPDYLDALLTRLRRDKIDVVNLDEGLRRLAPDSSARPFVCFTFDDGYRDNYEHAFAVFRRHEAPFTIYVTTGFVDATMPMWWRVLEVALARRERLTVAFEGRETTFELGDDDARQRAFDAVAPAFFRVPIAGVRALVDTIAAAAGIDPAAACAGEICSWEMLAEMRASGLVEIGCHTVNHPVLVNESAADARAEIEGARERIAARLGAPPRHFAYPYGKPDHADRREFALAGEAGFASAVTTRKASLFAAHRDHPLALPRVEVSPSFAASPHYLRTVLAGLPLLAWNGGRRVVVN
jgi:peptidoglycan/xylan/chitin deacetylase (PgdA/CDA1 family)